MTLNKYRKYNESLHLDDGAKDEITANLLKAEITPVRPVFRFRIAAVCVFVLAAFGFLLIPAIRNASSKTEAGSAAETEAVSEAAEETTAYTAAEDAFSTYPGIVSAVTEDLEDGVRRTTLVTETNTITVLITNGEEKGDAAAELPAENSMMENLNKNTDTVSEYTGEAGGIRYRIEFAEPVSIKEAEQLAEYLQETGGLR